MGGGGRWVLCGTLRCDAVYPHTTCLYHRRRSLYPARRWRGGAGGPTPTAGEKRVLEPLQLKPLSAVSAQPARDNRSTSDEAAKAGCTHNDGQGTNPFLSMDAPPHAKATGRPSSTKQACQSNYVFRTTARATYRSPIMHIRLPCTLRLSWSLQVSVHRNAPLPPISGIADAVSSTSGQNTTSL